MSDTVCQFYTKIGACRHGEKCSKRHIKPVSSNTILLSNLYQNPKLDKNEQESNPIQVREFFENFYKDIFVRLARIGKVVSLVVCENANNHLNGNVYCKFGTEAAAQQAVIELNQEWFGKRPVHCELTPVRSFSEANCRAYDNNSCTRDHCNFMHVMRPTPELEQTLQKAQAKSIILKNIERAKSQLLEQNVPEPQQVDFKSAMEAIFTGQKSN